MKYKLTRIIFYFLLFIVVVLMLSPSSSSFARDDWGYWSEHHLKIPLNKKFDLKLKTEFRMRNDFKELFQFQPGAGIAYKPTKWLEIFPQFIYESEESPNGETNDELRFLFGPKFKWKVLGLEFSDNNRVELRSINDRESWRYRHRFKIKKPLSLHNFKFAPFVSDELFIDSRVKDINQNRAILGIEVPLFKYMSIDLFYLMKSDRKKNHWKETHFLGTELNISF